MTQDAAVVAIVAALAIGFYAARWFQAEDDQDAAKARAANATRAAWRARGVMLAVALAGLGFIDMWFRGKGR